MITRRAKAAAAALGVVFAMSSATGVAQAADPVYPSLPKTVTCSAGTNSTKSVLKVKMAPSRKGTKSYSFTVRKLTTSGWKTVRTYKTKGKGETRSINLKKGTYQVVCKGAGGYSGAVSSTTALRK
jgi:hypothetical protein